MARDRINKKEIQTYPNKHKNLWVHMKLKGELLNKKKNVNTYDFQRKLMKMEIKNFWMTTIYQTQENIVNNMGSKKNLL